MIIKERLMWIHSVLGKWFWVAIASDVVFLIIVFYLLFT